MSASARLVVVGPGRVGQSLAAGLATAGEGVELRGRSPEPPALVVESADVAYARGLPGVEPEGGGRGAPAASAGHGRGAPPATLVFAVPDDDLASAARAWAEALEPAGAGAPGPPVALHTSGVHGPEVLAPLREIGFAVASWHPLTSLAAPSADAFRGVAFGVSGDGPAVERSRSLTGRLGGRVLDVEPGEHARYHAAAVFASNFLAACLAAARDELENASSGRAGLGDLAPLARAALANVLDRGLPDGVTGPVERGDVGTVRRHLEALSPERRRLYRDLARELLAVVQDRLPEERARELRELLGPADP